MAYDTGLAQILRDALLGLNVTEQPMMGGLSFMSHGHMLCGVHKNGAMFRVGKPNHAAALAIQGVQPMTFTGRPMSGFVDVSDAACADDARRSQLLAMAQTYIATLPPK
jgi:hypothetical protein